MRGPRGRPPTPQLVADDDAVGHERLGEAGARDEAVVQEHGREDADERHLVGLAHRVPRRAGLALADEPRDGLRGEEPGLAQPRLVEELADVGGRVRADEGADDRRAVRALLPPGDLRREPVLDGLAQEVLLVQPAQAELVGKARSELGDAVVEEGETTFDRMAHQHPVALRVEQVAVQEGGDLQVLGAAERRHLHEPRRQARLEAFGRVAREAAAARTSPWRSPSSREVFAKRSRWL